MDPKTCDFQFVKYSKSEIVLESSGRWTERIFRKDAKSHLPVLALSHDTLAQPRAKKSSYLLREIKNYAEVQNRDRPT